VKVHGHCISVHHAAVLCGIVGVRKSVRAPDGRQSMTVLYVIAGVIALALLIYLFVALLKPEAFE
jgi:K+-transporting ATPase KdpF subunit